MVEIPPKKKEEMKMKKIIAMMLCGAALTGFSSLSEITCSFCGGAETETSCQVWFNGKGSGKISCSARCKMYKAVKSLKINSCQLVIGGGDDSNATVKVVISGTKKDVGSFEKTLECSEFAWNVFGKNLSKVTSGNTKKSVTLDSEMFFKASDEDNTMEVAGVLTGKVKAKTADSCTPCGDPRTVKWTPGTFKGRFVGWSEAVGCSCARELTVALGVGTCADNKCLTFVEPESDPIEMFDGEITLKYDSKNSGYMARVVS